MILYEHLQADGCDNIERERGGEGETSYEKQACLTRRINIAFNVEHMLRVLYV